MRFFSHISPGSDIRITPCAFQGHGPRCRFFRHHLIGELYSVSTIGEPADSEDAVLLADRYETVVYFLPENRPLGRVGHRTEFKALREHRKLRGAIARFLASRRNSPSIADQTQVLLPGVLID